MNIKSYDNGEYSYSGTDEEYAEFLKSVDGKLNEGEPVEESDLGDTKKINLQGVIEKFRKTAGEIKDVSKKITAEAINKIDDFKKSREVYEADEEIPEEEIVFDEDSEEESDNTSDALYDSLKLTADKAEEILAEAKKLSEKLDNIDINNRDFARSAEDIKHKTDSVYGGVEEIRKAVSGITKLNDSIFDLKNAQLNSKNSLEELESGFLSLKKKCVWGVTIVSILTLISIVMEVIILLS